MRWFEVEHVKCRPTKLPVKESFFIQADDHSRKSGRLKKTLLEVVVGIDLKKCNLSEDLAKDRLEWRNIIHIVTPT